MEDPARRKKTRNGLDQASICDELGVRMCWSVCLSVCVSINYLINYLLFVNSQSPCSSFMNLRLGNPTVMFNTLHDVDNKIGLDFFT